jgi:hypothetical protein
MQIGTKGIEKCTSDYVIQKQKLKKKKHKFENTPFHSSLLDNWLSKFQFGIVIKKDRLLDLTFLYLNQF